MTLVDAGPGFDTTKRKDRLCFPRPPMPSTATRSPGRAVLRRSPL